MSPLIKWSNTNVFIPKEKFRGRSTCTDRYNEADIGQQRHYRRLQSWVLCNWSINGSTFFRFIRLGSLKRWHKCLLSSYATLYIVQAKIPQAQINFNLMIDRAINNHCCWTRNAKLIVPVCFLPAGRPSEGANSFHQSPISVEKINTIRSVMPNLLEKENKRVGCKSGRKISPGTRQSPWDFCCRQVNLANQITTINLRRRFFWVSVAGQRALCMEIYFLLHPSHDRKRDWHVLFRSGHSGNSSLDIISFCQATGYMPVQLR